MMRPIDLPLRLLAVVCFWILPQATVRSTSAAVHGNAQIDGSISRSIKSGNGGPQLAEVMRRGGARPPSLPHKISAVVVGADAGLKHDEEVRRRHKLQSMVTSWPEDSAPVDIPSLKVKAAPAMRLGTHSKQSSLETGLAKALDKTTHMKSQALMRRDASQKPLQGTAVENHTNELWSLLAEDPIETHGEPQEEKKSKKFDYCNVGIWSTAKTLKLTGNDRYRCKEKGVVVIKKDDGDQWQVPVGGFCHVQCPEAKGLQPKVKKIACVVKYNKKGVADGTMFEPSPDCEVQQKVFLQIGGGVIVLGILSFGCIKIFQWKRDTHEGDDWDH